MQRKAIVAAVGLLLLSVATLPAAASAGETAGTAVRAHADVAGGALLATVGTGEAADTARRDRLLAMPGTDSIGLPLLVALAGLLVLLVGGVILLSRHGRTTERTPSRSNGTRDEETEVPATTKPTRSGDRDGGSPMIRTDEEYVVQLLIANHGRMKQARIVEETDWSKAKVSRLLSRMEDQDQVVRERAGREKIVQLADANTSVPL